MSEAPTISVTKNDKCTECIDYDVKGLISFQTDIGDLESDYDHISNSSFDSNKSDNSLYSPLTTDIEDYNEPFSDDEASDKYPVLKLSLKEFLSNNITEKRAFNNELGNTFENGTNNDIMTLKKSKPDDDCLTDHETYSNISDDNNTEKHSIAFDLSVMHLENGNTEAHTEQFKESDDELSKSDCIDYLDETYSGCTSENEVFELSGFEEDAQILRDSFQKCFPEINLPGIEVVFISGKKNDKNEDKNIFADASLNFEDSLTDIERLELSAAETTDDESAIPVAKAVIIGSTNNSITDAEEVNDSELTRLSYDFEALNDQYLPPVHREMILIKENISGDPITHVMTMENNFQFGLVDNLQEDMLTDVEDLSSAIEDSYDLPTGDAEDFKYTLENYVINLSENVTNFNNKRNINQDLTDTEDIVIPHSVRRKKNKSKTFNKSTSRLNERVPRKETGTFDTKTFNIFFTNRAVFKKTVDPLSKKTSLRIPAVENSDAVDILQESYTTVHEKCTNLFNVEKEKIYIKGLKDCLETLTDVEYMEEEVIKQDRP